ncbi:MAG: SpoIIE family protein phosphatase [Candidatus Cloacimonas sp.]
MENKREQPGLAYQIIVFIFFFLIIIFSVYIGITRFLFSEIMMENSRESISHLAHETVSEIESRFTKVVDISHIIISLYHADYFDRKKLDTFLYDLIYEFNTLESVTIAYAPEYYLNGNSRTIYQNRNQPGFKELKLEDYQYLDWFQIPYELKSKYWTEPWYDANSTKQIVISYCVPLFAQGKCVGIMRMDTKLSDLQRIVSPLKLERSGYAFLISSVGTIITHPADSLTFNESIFSLAEAANDSQLRQIGENMIKGETDFVHLQGDNILGDSWLYYTPLLTNNWSLGIVIAHKDVVKDLNLLLIIQTLFSLVIFITISLVVYYRTFNVSKPIRYFADIASKIGQGDFDAQLPLSGNSYEIDHLIQSFSAMQESLKVYIKNLEITIEEKNRILAEVQIASKIQQKLIPENTEHPYDIKAISCYGILEPAGVIGGDLYDFFPVDESQFLFVIADVAGKGIVAAMTMTMVSTYLRTISTYHYTASEILQNLNNFLCKQSSVSNFVTALLGIIDLEKGELEFSNAGHTPLIIKKKGNRYKIYSETHSTPLGVFENMQIGSSNLMLDKGDELILFTDGITETMDEAEDFLGIKGVVKIIRELSTDSPEQTATQIIQKVHNFAKNAAVRDDITILVIDYWRA